MSWLFWLCLIGFVGIFPGLCNCGSDCTIFTDDFSSNDISTNWTTASSGSWSISGGTLNTSSTNAYLIANGTAPTCYMRVNVYANGASGDIVRLYGAYQNSTTFIAAEFKFGASGYIKLYSGTTLLGTYTGSLPTGGAFIELCCNSTGLRADIPNTSMFLNNSTLPPSGGLHAGVGTGATNSGVTFDTFSYSRTDISGCSYCSIFCSECAADPPPSYRFKVTISGYSDCATGGDGGLSHLNGVFFLNFVGDNFGQCIWSCPIPFPYSYCISANTCGSGGFTQEIWLIIYNPSTKTMQLKFNSTGTIVVSQDVFQLSSITCGQSAYTLPIISHNCLSHPSSVYVEAA